MCLRRNFRVVGLLLAWVLPSLPGCLAASATTLGDDALFEPLARYQEKNRRDPFLQPQAGTLQPAMGRVDIEVLKLTGVIYHPRRSLALFTSQTGPKFGYLLRKGKLWRENHQPVQGVTGTVVSREQVVLKQGEKRMVFRLR